MPTISYIRGAINDEIETISNSTSSAGTSTIKKVKKEFETFTTKLRAKINTDNMHNISELKKLLNNIVLSIKNISTQKDTIKIGKKFGYNINFENTEGIVNRINNDIILLGKNNINIYPIVVSLGDLTKSVASFIIKYDKKMLTKSTAEEKKGTGMVEQWKIDQQREKNTTILNIDIIEPLPLFIILGFLNDNTDEFKTKLQTELGLTSELLPKDYTMFENFNELVTKKHLTGQYYEYNIIKSDISKTFKKLEAELQDNINLSGFSKIPKDLMDKYNHEISEVNTMFKIMQDFKNKNTIDYSNVWIGVFVNIFQRFLKDIKNIEGKRAFSKFIIRSLELLEIRRKIYSQDIESLVKDGGIISSELAHAINVNSGIDNQNVPTDLNDDNAEANVENEHYNDRFEENTFFNEDDLLFAFNQ
jgi:hypothetical protein